MAIGPLPRTVALAYHGVGEVEPGDDPHRLIVSPSRLAAHVRMLARTGFAFLTAGELIDRRAAGTLPPRSALLTFDDGWADAVEVTAPLLRQLGASATFYVCPGLSGGQHELVTGAAGRLLTDDQLVDLVGLGMEIGSHTLSHPDLRQLDDTTLWAELADSRARLQSLLEMPCRTLAYPYGYADERVQHAARDAGYELAWSWGPGHRGRLHQPRLPAPARHGALRLALKLVGVRRPAY